MGLVLAAVVTHAGPVTMLVAEAAFAVVGVLVFIAAANVHRLKPATARGRLRESIRGRVGQIAAVWLSDRAENPGGGRRKPVTKR